jgi:hypothetical protein
VLNFLNTGIITPAKISSPKTLLILIILNTTSLLILKIGSSYSEIRSYIKWFMHNSCPNCSQSSSIRIIDVKRLSSSSESLIHSKIIGIINYSFSIGVSNSVILIIYSVTFGSNSYLNYSSKRSY